MRRILELVFDKEADDSSSFFEMGQGTTYGQTQITGLARINGVPVGVSSVP